MSAFVSFACVSFASGQENFDKDRYRREIKPLLGKHCSSCHGPQKQEGGLRLDTGLLAIAGGDSGKAIIGGEPDNSLLMKRLTGADELERMPPEGEGLSVAEMDLVKRWISAGAPSPDDEVAERHRSDHWAFRRPIRATLPHTKSVDWVQTPIDRFILAALESRGIAPAPEAARATLLRRWYLDLLGVLPSPTAVESFEADARPDAIQRVIDQLLASPSYGERWGRHWLDQARYADSNGYTRDFGRDIWPFREWVIWAINHDKPFDEFTVEQIAGDLLPNAQPNQIVATGFHRNTLINEEGGTDQEQFRVEAVADRVATTGSVWLGLTVGCARCHNHKYDPISQREYYQLFAFLNNCDEPTVDAPTPLNLEQGDVERRGEIRGQIADREKQLESQQSDLETKQREWEALVTPEQRARLPGPIQVAYDMPFEKRDENNKKLIQDYYRRTDKARETFPLLDEIAKLRESEPKIPKTMVLRERVEPRLTHVHKRGDFLSPGVQVEPAVPAVLPDLHNSGGKPNRMDLARWLTDPANPLTPRVIMNRHWQLLFGRGLVETEDDFGTQGMHPTHPELLDWLAVEFSNGDQQAPLSGSIKRMHRMLVNSATYQQSSQMRPNLTETDPRNDLLSRQTRLRVEAEVVRDAALTAAGLLTPKIGGPSVLPPQPEGVYAFTQDPKAWTAATDGDRYRRGMYTFFWRSLPYPMLTAFDAPNANLTCTRRIRSNTPLQALTMANDIVFVECAQALARRIVHECSSDPWHRGKYAFRICLARSPTNEELSRVVQLANEQFAVLGTDIAVAQDIAGSKIERQADVVDLATWTVIGRILLNLDEFITRE